MRNKTKDKLISSNSFFFSSLRGGLGIWELGWMESSGPGNRWSTHGCPWVRRRLRRSWHCVDLPARSRPSIAMRAPRVGVGRAGVDMVGL